MDAIGPNSAKPKLCISGTQHAQRIHSVGVEANNIDTVPVIWCLIIWNSHHQYCQNKITVSFVYSASVLRAYF